MVIPRHLSQHGIKMLCVVRQGVASCLALYTLDTSDKSERNFHKHSVIKQAILGGRLGSI